ncbi:hypothetical protein TEQG_02879 [Trichophyton equinum CBS 127.97]|uniref:Uncharacterized protein n=1 Tax=Trichophyton equinum (strain ATCC MYA-4606 / CBS 127.97) TaxID=559882 RepID=F2PPM7_TRIEC|nr:hypothetical protein TEQG_02879 [Trichophyton equinum CBS 127.97]
MEDMCWSIVHFEERETPFLDLEINKILSVLGISEYRDAEVGLSAWVKESYHLTAKVSNQSNSYPCQVNVAGKVSCASFSARHLRLLRTKMDRVERRGERIYCRDHCWVAV